MFLGGGRKLLNTEETHMEKMHNSMIIVTLDPEHARDAGDGNAVDKTVLIVIQNTMCILRHV